MSHDIRQLSDAVLHEGYLLYPYRASSLKNLHRYPFGTLFPAEFCRVHDAGDPVRARVECIAMGPPDARVSLEARFLHIQPSGAVVRDASMSSVLLSTLAAKRHEAAFEFDSVRCSLSLGAADVGAERWKLTAELHNTTAPDGADAMSRNQALQYALGSAHLLLRCEAAEFVSSIDPPDAERELVKGCRGEGMWPVLVGTPGTRDTLLAAPIILYDYPALAPESPGDFFDVTEIDELLTLRVLTLTDEEKRAMSEGDPRARALLERTERAGLAKLAELHGRIEPRPGLRPGATVRLHPKGRADIFDLALEGKQATVQAVERDLEGRTYVAITVDDDPGQDLGVYGHRFFFKPEEVELL